jgi:hypothetical protein
LATGHTDLSSAAKHVGLDAAGVGIGAWVGGKAGASVGSFLGPVGMVAGTITGTFPGMMFGRSATNEMKYAAFKTAGEHYEKALAAAQAKTRTLETKMHQEMLAVFETEQRTLEIHGHKVRSSLERSLARCQQWYEGRCANFVHLFPEVLARVEKPLTASERAELCALGYSSWPRRLIWPAAKDVRRGLVKEAFGKRLAVIRKAYAEFRRLCSQTPAQIAPIDGVRRIQVFVRKYPFESLDFRKLCQQLARSALTLQKKASELTDSANSLTSREQAARLANLRAATARMSKDVADSLAKEAAGVNKAKENLLKEARKLDIDLESGKENEK